MKTAFEYLVERIVSRRCLPLVGAGISTNAHKGGARWAGHKVETMIDKVLERTITARLLRLYGAPPNVRGIRVCSKCRKSFQAYGMDAARHSDGSCWICDLREARDARALTKVCEAFLWEHGGPNDASTYDKLVRTLEIREFAELEPTPAHFYLAFLAREGLISEVVTTNYDCNLEHAYDATWPNRRGADVGNACAIYDLPSFALEAARSSHWRHGDDTAHPLKVYKINGCAAQLRKDWRHATEILLTASQLQDWRARRWAGDFFRTKVRTACLVTVGFGSDEPQVVHTLQQVLEEFSGIRSDGRPAPAASVFDASNAPVVTTYDHYPSFQQLQLVNGFAAWWTGTAANGANLVIGPYQRPAPEEPGTPQRGKPPGLAADVLWADVFQAVFTRLLVNQLRDAAVTANAAFTSVVPYSNQHLSVLAEQLNRNSEARLASSSEPVHWLGEFEVEGKTFVAARPQLTLSIAHMLERESRPSLYKALSDHAALFAELAFILSLLEPMHQRSRDSATSRLGIWQRLILRSDGVIEVMVEPAGNNVRAPSTSVFVSCARTCPIGRPLETSGSSTGGKRLEIVVGAVRGRSNDHDRRCYAIGPDGQTPVAVVRLDWVAIFPPTYPVKDYEGVSNRLADAILFPTKYRRRLDASIRSNRFLVLESDEQ